LVPSDPPFSGFRGRQRRGKRHFYCAGDDGVFSNVPFVGKLRPTPNINGELGPLNPYAFDSAPVNPINGPGINPLPPLQGVQQGGFQQYWNAGLTAYLARWYSNTPLNSFGPIKARRR
jgi:hypothetical protein